MTSVMDTLADAAARLTQPSWAGNEAVPIAHELAAIFDECKVSDRFREFCSKSGVTTPTDLAAAAPEETKVQEEIIAHTEFGNIGFQEKVAIRKAWLKCRGRMSSASSASGAPQSQAPPKRMPEGSENRLRGLFKTLHGINLPGSWLVTEGVMTQMYLGLHASNKSLYVPDISSILRKSMLNQKPARGTLITDHGLEQIDYSMSPCSTHPEFFLRFRSYVMTISFLVIETPDFLPFETALELVDYVFEAINCRPDGRRPGLSQLTACFLSMFGDYAKALQNEGTTFDAWLASHLA